MKLYIEIWTDSYNRDQGHSHKRFVYNHSLEKMKTIVEDYYNTHIKSKGGSMEILNTNETLFHISNDSNHQLKLVKKDLVEQK